jgi:hypothetical protein
LHHRFLERRWFVEKKKKKRHWGCHTRQIFW